MFISAILLISANDHIVRAGIHNHLFHYPSYNLFAHSKHFHSLLYFTSYKAIFLFKSNAMRKVINLNKKFCRSTTLVLAAVCKPLNSGKHH